MKATIEIDMNNATYAADPLHELGRDLVSLANKVAGGYLRSPYTTDKVIFEKLVRDENGNTIGKLEIKDLDN